MFPEIKDNEKAVIFVRTTFVAYHRYAEAPEEVAFLRHWHRHVFHVRAFFPVDHANRDLEFFMVKKKLNDFLCISFEGRYLEYSCEQFAILIKEAMDNCNMVEVSEDGENGAIVFSK